MNRQSLSSVLDMYAPHETQHLFKGDVQLYTITDVPENIVNEILCWAPEDQGDDWDFNQEFWGADFLVGTVLIQDIINEWATVLNRFKGIGRLDWEGVSYDETFDEFHDKYMKRAHEFSTFPNYTHWQNSTNPITLVDYHDDPNFVVIRDGLHRFNFAHASEKKEITAMTTLWRKQDPPYQRVWELQDDMTMKKSQIVSYNRLCHLKM
jgi:hypothetical protein